jgi:hypothetical protein
VEDVGDLEIRPVYKDEVATDKDVHVIGRRRGKRDFQFMRTWLHPGAKFDGYETLSDDEALLPRRKTIAFCQAGRQLAVMRVIPASDLAVMVVVCLTPFVSVGVSMAVVAIVITVMIPIAVMIPAAVVTIVFVVPMVVILGNGKCCRESQHKNCERGGAETEL